MSGPLDNVPDAANLLGLPYFDFLACLGEFALHPHGIEGTSSLLRAARVKQGERILEIGCGTGTTTRRLVGAGASVTVVDTSRRMLQATEACCRRYGVAPPTAILGSVDDLRDIPNGQFDFVLCECVLGFVVDKVRAFGEMHRVLAAESGRIGIIDFHYRSRPPADLLKRLEESCGIAIAPLSATDWRSLIQGAFSIAYWKECDPPTVLPMSRDLLRQSLELNGARATADWLTDDVIERLVERWQSLDAVFAENRRFLGIHHVVASVGFTSCDV